MSPETIVQLSIPESMLAEVKARYRDSLSEGVLELLDRYVGLMRGERKWVREIFTPSELMLLAEANKGVVYTTKTIENFDASIKSLDGERCESLGVNKDILLIKTSNIPFSQLYALVDAIERYWVAKVTSDAIDPAKMLED